MKKILISGVVLLLVVLAVLASRPQPVEVELSAVELTPLSVLLQEEGETRVRDRYQVSAPVSGRVLRILLEPGDAVVADETLLARFLPVQPVPLDARSKAEATAAMRAAQSALGRAQADRKRIVSELRFAESEKRRYLRLVEEGVVAEEVLERAKLTYDTTLEASQGAEFAVAAAQSELQAAQARLIHSGSTSDGRVAEIRIFSPVNGVVLRRIQESETVVRPGALLLEVGDPGSLEIVADFLSSDAVQMEAGQKAKIRGWGGSDLDATVRRVEPSGFTKVSALGVEEQRVNVILDLDSGQPGVKRLGDGFRVVVEVEVWTSESELTVDNGGLFRRGSEWALFVVANEKVAERVVEIGRRGERRSQVLSGVEKGETVVAYPPSNLVDGVAVKAADSQGSK